MKICSTCHKVRWPLTDRVSVCPECDGTEVIRNNARRPTVRPDTELQRKVDEVLRGTVYDWEKDGI